jgi:hypothetical protein
MEEGFLYPLMFLSHVRRQKFYADMSWTDMATAVLYQTPALYEDTP